MSKKPVRVPSVTVRSFMRRNANLLTGVLAVTIVVEGSVAWFYPSRWWQPLVLIAAVSALILAWRNLKSVIKFVASLGLAIVLSALAIQSGFYLTGSAVGGTIWGLSVLSSWAVSVMASYMIVSTRSRWGVALAAAISGYAASYLLMGVGVVGIYLISVATAIVVTIALLKSDWFSRVGKRSPAVVADWRHGKIADAVESLWPSSHEGALKLDGKRSVPVWHGTGSPVIVFVPLDLDEPLEPTAKHGLTYHGRDVRDWLLWLSRKISSKGLKPAPLVILVDVNGANDSTSGKPEIVRVPDVDSMSAIYYGLMDGTGSRAGLRTAITDLARRFDGMSNAGDKEEKRLAKLLDHVDSPKAASDGSKTADAESISERGDSKAASEADGEASQ